MSLRIDYGKIAPEAAKSMYATNRYLDESSIDQGLRRMIELRVSQINGCNYCIWLHSRQAREVLKIGGTRIATPMLNGLRLPGRNQSPSLPTAPRLQISLRLCRIISKTARSST